MGALSVLFLFALGLVAVRVLRAGMARRDTVRREEERAAYDARRETERLRKADARIVAVLDRFFPVLRGQLDPSGSDGPISAARLRTFLEGIDGIRLGGASIGFPAVLPIAERRKHLVCFGKSGYGKTTIALRLIARDFEDGRGICVLGSEAEFFRDWLLPLVPPARSHDVIAFRPADPRCTLTWNPLALEEGDDRALAAGQLFSVFKRAVGDESIGPRADAILSNAFALLVGHRGATLQSVGRLLADERFRASVVSACDDPYIRDFWTTTFPEYPGNAVLPLAHRLNQFLRLPQLRAALCHPVSSFSIREALALDQVLLFDVSGLDPDATRLVGQLLLSKFQIELMRRERVAESARHPFHVYVDEFHCFADAAEGTWRELLARGRRYGLGLHLFTQHPNQIPRSLLQEILGNVSSVIALNLSAGDAAVVRRELLVPDGGGELKPVPAEQLVSLSVGEGFARLGSGACALKVRFSEPLPKPDARLGDRIREASWRAFAAPPVPSRVEPGPPPRPAAEPQSCEEGRGGARHKLLQRLVREWGEARGFRASLEEPVLNGAGRVDVALVRGDVRLAVEVAVTSTPEEMAASLVKAFTAGFSHAVVVFADVERRDRCSADVMARLDARERPRVAFVDPDGLRAFLDALPAPEPRGNVVAGFQVVVKREPALSEGTRRALSRLVGEALLRTPKSA